MSRTHCCSQYALPESAPWGVSVNHRGQGIGAKLNGVGEQWALQRDAAEVRLNVWAFNEPALAMYNEPWGYEVRSYFALASASSGNGA